MTKKLFLIVAIFALNFQITSCTSKESDDETTIVENADVEKIDAEDTLADGEADLNVENSSMQAALGESTTKAESNKAVNEPSVLADMPADVASAPTLDESSLDEPALPASNAATDLAANSPTNDAAVVEAPLVEEPPVATVAEVTPEVESSNKAPSFESSNSDMSSSSSSDFTPPVAKASGTDTLKKIALTAPYQTPKGWVNSVYMARPGETLIDISQKIFAADKVKDLKKIAENSYLKWRSVRPGDKLYYVSPNRPDDSAKTLFYYEDMGMVPETYVAKKGDNLKKVAKEILGYKNAYVEMWAANPVESKGKLTEGETIKYWRSASGVTSAVASNSPKAGTAALVDTAPPAAQETAQYSPPPAAEMPPLPETIAATNEMPAAPAATASLPPPPSMDQQPMPATDVPANAAPTDATASLPPPPPPPPPADMAPPAPIDEVAATAKHKKANDQEVTEAGGLDNDTMMSLGAVVVLMAALAFVLIRRKKKKAAEMAAAMNETHVGS